MVELTLKREGKEITLSVTLEGTSEKPLLEADIVDITITERTDRTNSQCAIWAGILGTKW